MTMRAKKLCALFLALAMALSLCSCWEEDEKTDDFWNEELPLEEEPPQQQTARISAFALPYLSNQTLDPVTCVDGIQQAVGALLYEGLFALDETFSVQNVLCRDYTYDAEKHAYTFSLRENVTFSDGSLLSVTDVLSAYRRAAGSERYAARFENVASMHIVNGALVVTLNKDNSAFPALLDIPIVKSGSEKNLVPLGTGPYLFLTDNEGACLVRNGDWWRSSALPLDRIALVPARDNSTGSSLFSSYDTHLLVSDLTAAGSDGSFGSVDLFDADSAAMLYLGFNTRHAPLKSSALRCAMSTAFDRDVIVSTLLSGHARATRFPISPRAALYPDDLSAPAASYAQALSDERVTDAHPKELTLLVNEESSFRCSVAEHLCRRLSVGALSVTLRAVPWEDYLKALETGDFDLYLGEARLTADWNAATLIGTGGKLNYGGYTDPESDRLLAAFLSDENTTTAQAYLRYFAASAPIAPICFKSVSTQIPAGLAEGLTPTAQNPFYNFENWTFHLDTQP